MFRLFFFSKKTVWISAITAAALSLAAILTKVLTDSPTGYDYFDAAIKLLMALFLCRSYEKHDLLAMQAGCAGLLFCMLYDQAAYVFEELLTQDLNLYLQRGFWGSFYLAGELALLFFEGMIAVNYFFLHILKNNNSLRVMVNQTMIQILMGQLLVQMFVVSRLSFEAGTLIFFGTYHLNLLALYVLITCCELILSVDAAEGRGAA